MMHHQIRYFIIALRLIELTSSTKYRFHIILQVFKSVHCNIYAAPLMLCIAYRYIYVQCIGRW